MILSQPLPQSTIRALRGIVDVYTIRGRTIARSWPRKPNQPNTPAQVAARNAFSAASRWVSRMPEAQRQRWRESHSWKGCSWADIARGVVTPLAATGTIPDPPLVSSMDRAPGQPPGMTLVRIRLAAPAGTPDPGLTWAAAPAALNGEDWLLEQQVKKWCKIGLTLRTNRPALNSYILPLSIAYDPAGPGYVALFPIPDQPLSVFPTRAYPLVQYAPVMPPKNTE